MNTASNFDWGGGGGKIEASHKIQWNFDPLLEEAQNYHDIIFYNAVRNTLIPPL